MIEKYEPFGQKTYLAQFCPCIVKGRVKQNQRTGGRPPSVNHNKN